jgi:hypothetical protein
MNFNIGDTVLFGRANGEKTRGRIVKVNPSSVKIEQTEARGGHAVGSIWRVPPTFIYPLEALPSRPSLPTLAIVPPVQVVSPPRHRIGQRVSFATKGRTITGTVVRINEKTVSIDNCDDGSRGWRVSHDRVYQEQ